MVGAMSERVSLSFGPIGHVTMFEVRRGRSTSLLHNPNKTSTSYHFIKRAVARKKCSRHITKCRQMFSFPCDRYEMLKRPVQIAYHFVTAIPVRNFYKSKMPGKRHIVFNVDRRGILSVKSYRPIRTADVTHSANLSGWRNRRVTAGGEFKIVKFFKCVSRARMI